MKVAVVLGLIFSIYFLPALCAAQSGADVIVTSSGDLKITFIGHGSLMLEFEGKVIHVDPFSRLADYSKLPRADLIFMTHHHRDHMDTAALAHIRTKTTMVVLTEKCAETIEGGIVMRNGDRREVGSITVEAVPAYNLVHNRDDGRPFHPKGEGNGYVLTFGDKMVYIAGDTENVPEMKKLEGIDVAFLPMNLPYTMTPEMVADAVRGFLPKVLYPYHYGDTETSRLTGLLDGLDGVEIRIREMK